MNTQEEYMSEAVKSVLKGLSNNKGGPFGCIVVKDGEIVGRGNNKVTSTTILLYMQKLQQLEMPVLI